MTIRPASRKDAQVLFGGYDCSSALEIVTFKETAALDIFKPLGSAYQTAYDTGGRSCEVTALGIADGNNTSLSTLTGTNSVATIKFDSDVLARRCRCFRTALLSEAEVITADGAMTRVQSGVAVTGEFNNGYIVAPLTARTDSGNTDADDADMGNTTSAGLGHMFLHVTAIALGGYANCLITLRNSDDATTWADHTAFTAVTAIGAEFKTPVAQVERYTSVSWLWQGGTPSGGHSITFSVAYARD
jgi:hypothetical protein